MGVVGRTCAPFSVTAMSGNFEASTCSSNDPSWNIFIIFAIGNLFLDADMEFQLAMLKFSVASFILIYPLSYFQQWRKNRSSRSAREVYFVENWFLFGKTFVQWKGLVEFRECALISDRNPKVLVISAKGFGRGQIEQALMIPIPENEIQSAEELVDRYQQ